MHGIISNICDNRQCSVTDNTAVDVDAVQLLLVSRRWSAIRELTSCQCHFSLYGFHCSWMYTVDLSLELMSLLCGNHLAYTSFFSMDVNTVQNHFEPQYI